MPVLVKLSGFDECVRWLSQFGSAGVKEELDEMFSTLNIKVRLHYNQTSEKHAVFVFNHPTGPFDHAFVQHAFHFFGLKGSVLGDEIMEDLLFVRGMCIFLSTLERKIPSRSKSNLTI